MFMDLMTSKDECCHSPVKSHVYTQRYCVERRSLRPLGETSNAGMACYVCENACKLLEPPTLLASNIRGLVEQIIGEAVDCDGIRLWRWEARPLRADYLYPPDWDDTCKAIDAIHAYEKVSNESLNGEVPSTDQLLELLKTSLFERKCVGEDVELTCENSLALYMFMARKDQKRNNAEDIFVTSVVLRTLACTMDVNQEQCGSLMEGLLARLCEAAEKGLANRVPFSLISRCYLSWGLFLLTLSDVVERMPAHAGRVKGLIEQYLKARVFVDLCGDELRALLAHDELCYARLLAKRVGISIDQGRSDQLSGMRASGEAVHLGLLYRHRRLGHIYGAAEWSSILNLRSTGA